MITFLFFLINICTRINVINVTYLMSVFYVGVTEKRSLGNMAVLTRLRNWYPQVWPELYVRKYAIELLMINFIVVFILYNTVYRNFIPLQTSYYFLFY